MPPALSGAWCRIATLPTALLLLHHLTSAQSPAPADCRAALQSAVGADKAAAALPFIDPATPASACTTSLCTSASSAACDTASPPKSQLQLVFSDEFSTDGQNFSAAANNSRWTALSMWCDTCPWRGSGCPPARPPAQLRK